MDDIDLSKITVKPSVLQKVSVRSGKGKKLVDTYINVSDLPNPIVFKYHNEYKVIYSPDNTSLQEIWSPPFGSVNYIHYLCRVVKITQQGEGVIVVSYPSPVIGVPIPPTTPLYGGSPSRIPPPLGGYFGRLGGLIPFA